jgi:hypothetical protein
MIQYRGYYIREDHHVVAPETIDAANDAEAMARAGELLATSIFARIEVWQESRLVGSTSTPPTLVSEHPKHRGVQMGAKILKF